MLPLLRYTLDLFDQVLGNVAEVENTAHTVTRCKTPFVAPTQEPQAHAKNATLAVTPAPLSAHPQATREACLQGAVVRYALVRAKRRSIGFVVGPQGLVVRAPKWVPLYEIDSALQEKGPWILRKLDETRARHTQQEATRIMWCEGVTLPYLGGYVQVLLDPAHTGKASSAHCEVCAPGTAAPPEVEHMVHALRVGLPPSATAEHMCAVVQTWFMRQAHANFVQRLQHFAPLLNVQWTRMRLSNAGARWGSAGVDGSIRLNWRLIHFRQAVIDYVVVHELSHLRIMNHSPEFWDTVRSVLPHYAALRDELKRDLVPRW